MQACFRHHDALEFGAAHIRVREGRSLNDLEPAPRFPELWKKAEAGGELLLLVAEAGSRLVRLWAMQLLKREHSARLAAMPASEILRLLDRDAVAAVSQARCVAVAGELADWSLAILGTAEAYDRQLVLRFFDSLCQPIRLSAWAWLTADGSPGYADPGLWSRLLETPYDELRLRLIDELARKASLPGAGAEDLTPVWCSVLLGVHRGGRQKQKAVRQVAAAIAKDPTRAADLLPVLVVAVRSVRPAEARAGLAAVVATLTARPELTAVVTGHLPELKLHMEAGA